MEAPCPRFTAAEGGTRLAATARARNTIVAEHTAFVATRLLHEEAFRIRGPLDANFQRSVYVTRPSRVACVAYHLAILTDLSVLGEAGQDPVTLGRDALDEKQVLVCTSKVIRQVLEEGVLAMENINVLIIDSCHLICKDQDLKYLMSIYKTAEETKRPRILALTYPLFTSTKKETAHDFSLDTTDNVDRTDNADITDNHDVTERSDTCVTVNVDTTGKVDATDNVDTTENNDTTEKGDTCTNVSEDDEGIEGDNTDAVDKTVTLDNVNYSNETKNVDNTADNSNQNPEDKQTEAKSPDSSAKTAKLRSKIGVYENYDDFKMYEKLEWKLDELEKELCCSVDLAEDIDSVKRVSATVTKPKELIIEFSPQPDVSALPESYVELETFMRAAVLGAIDFLNDHRYDPTEIYGEEMYEEFKNIPNPIIEPRQMFNQFLYVLDQLGPYGADKAAFCLLTKLEKLKIKVPYERHFLLLCLCTSVLLKIRCVAESAFASHETDWNRIQAFSTPKVLRFIEILAKFQPPSSPAESPSKTTNARNTSEDTKSLASIKLLTAIENLDFLTLGNKIEDTVNALDANLRELDGDVNELQGKTDGVVKDGKALQDKTDGLVKGGKEVQDKTDDVVEDGKALQEKTDNVVEEVENEMEKVEGIKGETGVCQQSNGVNFKGFSRRLGHRARGRGRPPRSIACRPQHPLHPDALCGIVFIREPLMAKILFMLIVELSRHHPQLNFLCAQYSAIERPADPVTEPREFEQQRKNQEEVLKKFRMHECNLLLATSAMEEGIDLPRCNLVLRWDIPASYRSYGLCRGRARAPRSACVLLAQAAGDTTERVLQNLATYKELDQIVSRKCGCGVQDEPPQSEEDHADAFTPLVAPYTPLKTSARSTEPASKRIQTVNADTLNCNKCDTERQNANGNCPCTEMFASDSDGKTVNGDSDGQVIASESAEIVSEGSVTIDPGGGITNKTDTGDSPSKVVKSDILGKISYQVFANGKTSDVGVKGDMGGDEIIASVDLSTAIALINRYCGKLPSDTFTRLAPQWRTEAVTLPTRGGAERTAYICTLRMPLNCPVKFNIVGHPMPTRVLARRMVALQACRILHKSGELDNQLMPIGKDNFKAAEVEMTGGNTLTEVKGDPNDLARPGTTKRRQYYFKRTARAFTDCQPVVDTSDSEIDPPGSERPRTWGEDTTEAEKKTISSQNVLYAIVYTLQCALPERYNTRGRRLHAPQNASQALAILTKKTTHPFQIPAFPVYTRSGEVRVSLAPAPAADARVSPRRARLIKAFMRFVFGEVLRVRRRGMRLLSEPGRANNYYIVPTIKTVRPNGTTKIDIDWAFLEVIYKHTEEKRLSELEKPLFWNQDDEETDDATQRDEIAKGNEEKTVQSTGDSEIVTKVETEGLKNEEKKKKEVLILEKSEGATETSCDVASDVKDQNQGDAAKTDTKQVTTKSVAENAINGAGHTKNGAENTINGAENTKNGAEDTKNGVENTKNGAEKTKVKKLDNPLLAPGETFHFDADKYKEAVVTPWYRNQDQPQYFLVAEICWRLSPDSAFPSATHATFRSYYESKYGVSLSQRDQPLLDVDHTSARLNLLTPRYVNRKGVALPVSSERTRRAKRDRLDQKQILVPELCRVHPFAAPLWFATVALPCVLYRINALLIADEIRQAVAEDVGLGIPRIDESTCPGFQWPPLDFGWSLAEVLNADTEKTDKKKPETDSSPHEEIENGSRGKEDNGSPDDVPTENDGQDDAAAEKTINDILQEKEDAQNGFEIGTWSNDMAASIPEAVEYDELLDPLPANLTFCTSASGGTNWCDPVRKAQSTFTPSRAFSVADSDCSYMSSDFDTDDSDLNSEGSDEDTDTSGFCSSRNSNAAMGVRIEYKTAHEAEAVDLERKKRTALAPQPDEADDLADKREQDVYMRSGEAPVEYIEKFHDAIENHKQEIHQKRLLILQGQPVENLLQEMSKPPSLDRQDGDRKARDAMLIEEMFPYGTGETERLFANGEVTLENIEKNKRKLLSLLRDSQPAEALTTLNCFSMKDVDIDAPDYVNEKVTNIGFDSRDSYMERLKAKTAKREFVPYYEDVTVSSSMKEFDFDYQPNLEGHPGPSPSLILQALTMSNANDGINLERLETIGDSFLKFAITAYLYCAHPTVHEGKLSHMRSKQVSNLNLYRLGRNKRLGARMIASKFEPHDNWLPPCHKPPATLDVRPNIDHQDRPEHSSGEGCFIPYNLITQHSIPDKSIADCVEALIGAYLLSCGGRGALLFMSWLGLRVLPRHEAAHPSPEFTKQNAEQPPSRPRDPSDSDSSCSDDEEDPAQELPDEEEAEAPCSWERRAVGSLRPYKDKQGRWWQSVFGELKAPPSPLLRYIADPEGELEVMLSGYDALERTLQYRFRDRSLLLQALTHASHQTNRLTDCYQRLEFLGDAILDYLITRHLYEDSRRHSPGALTDLRSALVNNTIFATLAVRHGFHKYFRHMSPGLNEVLTKYVKIQEENGHSISEEHYLIQEDEMEQAEDVEVPKALGDLFESVAGAIFLDSGMSLGAVWRSYVSLMGAELEAFSAAAPKSPVRELLEAEPDTAKFGKPERLADGRRVRVCVEVFGRGAFKGIGRNYRIAKGTAARCALRHLKKHRAH